MSHKKFEENKKSDGCSRQTFYSKNHVFLFSFQMFFGKLSWRYCRFEKESTRQKWYIDGLNPELPIANQPQKNNISQSSSQHNKGCIDHPFAFPPFFFPPFSFALRPLLNTARISILPQPHHNAPTVYRLNEFLRVYNAHKKRHFYYNNIGRECSPQSVTDSCQNPLGP